MQPGRVAATNSVTGLESRERVRGFELAAGLSVLFMILVHDLWHWGSPETWTTPIGDVISVLGGPTATPVFLFVMGASLAFSPSTGFGSLAARGAWLVVLGYLLNILRGVLPASLGMATGVVTQEQIQPFTPWWLLTSVDLHHVTGLSLVVLAALRVWRRPGWSWLLLAGAIAAAEPLVHGLNFGTPLLDAPLSPVIGGAPNVFYAVVPWVAYALLGAVFGRLLVGSPDRRRFFRVGALLGLGLLAVSAVMIVATNPTFDVYTYWQGPPAFVVGIVGIVLVWLAVCDAVSRRASLRVPLRVVDYWGERVIPMYFMHWIVVGWGCAIVGFRDLSLPQVLVASSTAVVLTTYLARFAIGLEGAPWRSRRLRRLLGRDPDAAEATEGPATSIVPALAYAGTPLEIDEA
ncbi:MAG: DUF1624 domain-containing protein [Chloroflexi bacterium]|nr:DUF1624 domain-containing protein [Chloroflexota bacterium]